MVHREDDNDEFEHSQTRTLQAVTLPPPPPFGLSLRNRVDCYWR
jgi:hypothetical protein